MEAAIVWQSMRQIRESHAPSIQRGMREGATRRRNCVALLEQWESLDDRIAGGAAGEHLAAIDELFNGAPDV